MRERRRTTRSQAPLTNDTPARVPRKRGSGLRKRIGKYSTSEESEEESNILPSTFRKRLVRFDDEDEYLPPKGHQGNPTSLQRLFEGSPTTSTHQENVSPLFLPFTEKEVTDQANLEVSPQLSSDSDFASERNREPLSNDLVQRMESLNDDPQITLAKEPIVILPAAADASDSESD